LLFAGKKWNKNTYDNECTHSAMPKDCYVINLIKNEIITNDKNLWEFSEDKRNAIKSYDKNYDYEQTCNDDCNLKYNLL